MYLGYLMMQVVRILASHAEYPDLFLVRESFILLHHFMLCAFYTFHAQSEESTQYLTRSIGENQNHMLILIYSQTYFFIIFIIIIRYTQWISHTFRCFTYIDYPIIRITASHESYLVQLTKPQGFQINVISKLLLVND